jgi:hypothetical protein
MKPRPASTDYEEQNGMGGVTLATCLIAEMIREIFSSSFGTRLSQRVLLR